MDSPGHAPARRRSGGIPHDFRGALEGWIDDRYQPDRCAVSVRRRGPGRNGPPAGDLPLESPPRGGRRGAPDAGLVLWRPCRANRRSRWTSGGGDTNRFRMGRGAARTPLGNRPGPLKHGNTEVRTEEYRTEALTTRLPVSTCSVFPCFGGLFP